MKRARNSDSETHVKKQNPTSRTEIRQKFLCYFSKGQKILDLNHHLLPELLGGAGESVLLVDGDNHMGWEREGHSSKQTFSVLALKDNIS